MSYRLGVFGGMFDPVHNGHVEAARFALQKLELDEIQLVPCHIPNHRNAAASSAQHRLNLLQLAIADETKMHVNPIEINSAHISYTVSTLAQLQLASVNSTLIFILGMDSFNSLPQWHRWQELFELCHFCVLARQGEAVLTSTAEALKLDRRLIQSLQCLDSEVSGRIYIAEDFRFDLSSTEVREKLQKKHDVSSLLNARVIEYINTHNLYH